MAKVLLNSLIIDIQGKLGDYVFRRSHTGEITLSKAPDMSRVQWSEAQMAHRQRFKEAVAYARLAMAEPESRAYYEKAARRLKKRPFALAVSGYFKYAHEIEN